MACGEPRRTYLRRRPDLGCSYSLKRRKRHGENQQCNRRFQKSLLADELSEHDNLHNAAIPNDSLISQSGHCAGDIGDATLRHGISELQGPAAFLSATAM